MTPPAEPLPVPDPDAFPAGRWRGRWIWGSYPPLGFGPGTHPVLDTAAAAGHVLLRRTFTLDAVPECVPARCTGDSRYVLWVNGVEVSRGPVRGHPQFLHHDLVDLAPHLVAGENVLAVRGRFYGDAVPWWMPSVPSFGLGGGAFLLEAALGDPADPATQWLTTDRGWRALQPDAWAGEGPDGDADGTGGGGRDRAIGAGETPVEVCDGRRLPQGWTAVGFDDAGWRRATELSTVHVGYTGDPRPPSHPYGALRPRPIPQLGGEVRRGRVTTLQPVPGIGTGTDTTDPDPVVQHGIDEANAGPLTPLPVAEPGITFDGDAPVTLVVVDFGEQVAGLVAIEVSAPAGTVIDAKAAEALGADGRLEALQQHAGFRYTCHGPAEPATPVDAGRGDVGPIERFETFDAIGLRHLGLAVRATGPVAIHAVTVRERLFPRHTATARPATDPTPVPTFACSDPELETIWRIGRRTVDLCSQDAYLDCPSREQRAWTGDAVVHQLVDLTTNLDWSLARWNVALGAAPRPDGMLPMAAGSDFAWWDRSVIPDWALHWVHALANVWRYTGDAEFVAEHLSTAERVLRWFVPFVDDHGTLTDVTGWLLVDWSAVSTTGATAVITALWVRALEDFSTMADGLGDAGRAAWARRLRDRAAAGFERFWDPARGVYVDNLPTGETPAGDRWGGPAGRPVSQHANAAAVVAGVVPAGRVRPLIETILDPARRVDAAWLVPGRDATLEGAGDMYAGFGYLAGGPAEPWWDVESGIVAAQPYFRYVVHDAVATAGLADRIPALCRDWSVLRGRSATTWSEVWYGGSHCHAWCATPTRDLVQRTLGVEPAVPGFGVAAVRPALGDLTWARGDVPTPAGLLHLEVTGDEVVLDSPVPVALDLTHLATARGAPAGPVTDLPAGRHTVAVPPA